MRLRGFPPLGTPAMSYVGSPAGSLVGSMDLPTGYLLPLPGLPGATGEQGPQGVQGIQGPPGPAGPKGDTGDVGPQGPQGNQGIQGQPGVSLDVEGHVATYAALSALSPVNGQAWVVDADGLLYFYDDGFPANGAGVPFVGDQGPTGATGIQGPKGDKGDKGDTGATGPQGVQGLQGLTGATGPQGPKGDTGATGPAGSNAWADITGKPTTFPPIIGSGATDAVAGNDSRLTNARTPTAHTHPVTDLTATGRTSSNFLRGDNTWATPLLPAGASATVATSETTNSSTYGNLTTTTDTVTVTVGPSGCVLVGVTAMIANSATSGYGYMAPELSGANTLAADDANAVVNRVAASDQKRITAMKLLTGLNPGSTTFKAKYRATGGTATFSARDIFAAPL